MLGSIGKYQIGRTLGSGASCKVKLGVDSITGKKVAVKIMKENMDQADLALIKTEVEALQGLKHINIVE
jgi:serine/threonine protein kinase